MQKQWTSVIILTLALDETLSPRVKAEGCLLCLLCLCSADLGCFPITV